jgi:hypothetical protein
VSRHEYYVAQTLQEQTLPMKINDYIVCVKVQWTLNLTHTKMCSHTSHPDVKKEATHFSQQLIAYPGFDKISS